ncbi:hypothetical protein [Mycolicibacterium fluoranthenivorans]|jgi:hypothetical protein|uniref:Uncharacterized protein n=1 Tax=Mycolicibacterium fluoranthenivorans TaxID=258505 RepID=A0A1G4WR30_9MYCO|nr:hypothetical protein [Mycolicibacterium fluoranthenivorans]SCX27826.1 hypothetical protein SAMN02799620_04432 [Mycolicibacterium fluoranthenivorans]
MKGLVYQGAGHRSWQGVPDPKIQRPAAAIVRVDAVTICAMIPPESVRRRSDNEEERANHG